MAELLKYLKNFEYERSIRLNARRVVDPNAMFIWNQAVNELEDREERRLINSAFLFAKNIPYAHVGLSSDIYFCHPIRVASLSMLSTKTDKLHFGTLGLLHNVLELSKISVNEISSRFGKLLGDEIKLLTVDRDLQWDQSYKKDYYQEIAAASFGCRVVKIIDKLDNFFLIGINPDEDVRDKYLREVEEYVLPMVKKDMPDVYFYMKELIKESRYLGFIGI